MGLKTVSQTSTVGISYDCFKNIFTFRVNNEFRYIKVNTDKIWPEVIAIFWHADKYDNDHISVNFGHKPFKYNIPEGYQPYGIIDPTIYNQYSLFSIVLLENFLPIICL